ncbi:coiled-coil domain-containing protein 201-like [Orycteropus afer afer]|uniref:Coiled-coil domain-containing protein 201-like n=1 Tax=Orycteropus afer afer TaxID=1230840 RepID=A0AC54Z8W3_ORYAF|nr:coiled-coil domain-containing protein 201-like [Orycteropus afer afer]
MELEAQIPEWSSSKEDNLSLVTGRSSLRKLIKHSTPEETVQSQSMKPLGEISSLTDGQITGVSLVPTYSFQDLPSHSTGLSSTATFRQRTLSTVSASKESNGQLGPKWHHLAPAEEPVTSIMLTTQQKSVSPQAWSFPRVVGWPGIPNMARRNRRDLKKRAAAMERVRQWEDWLLQNIEEAVQHELTIQPE